MLKLTGVILLLALQHTQWNTSKGGIAIEGFDPVSYFDGVPKEGLDAYSFTLDGAVFKFSSEKNLEKFKLAPGKYVPEYGGWCAYAMADSGDKVSINPRTFKITQGKLYLFYNAWGTNTLKPWEENEEEFQEKADDNWSSKYLPD